MSKTDKIDECGKALSWETSPARELVRLAWPIAISMLSYAVMTLVDTLFVGWLGSSELAAVGLGGTAVFALLCFCFGLMRGAKVLVSQARGAGENGAVGAFLGAALILAALVGGVILGASFGVAAVLPSLSATTEAGDLARDYFRIRMLSAPAILVFLAVREVRYGMGDSRWPMVAAVVGNLLNIGLDYLLIFEAGMGVEGAAWATTSAHVVETLLLLTVQAREGFNVGSTRLSHVAAVWRIGLPSGVQFLLEMGSFAVLASLLSKLSELDMAAHIIAMQIIHFSFLPALAVGEAASVMVGEAAGARREELVAPLARLALKGATLFMGVCALVFVFLGETLARGFSDEEPLVALTTQLLMVAAIFQVADGANVMARCVLRGVGDVRYPAVVCIAISWLALPPLTWLLGYEAGMGALGGWIGLCVEITVGAVILWWRLARGGWRAAAEQTRAEREEATLSVVPA